MVYGSDEWCLLLGLAGGALALNETRTGQERQTSQAWRALVFGVQGQEGGRYSSKTCVVVRARDLKGTPNKMEKLLLWPVAGEGGNTKQAGQERKGIFISKGDDGSHEVTRPLSQATLTPRSIHPTPTWRRSLFCWRSLGTLHQRHKT